MSAEQRLTVKLQADWSTGPFWVSRDDHLLGAYEIDEINEVLPLSPALLAEIDEWDHRFQETYDSEAGQESGFRTVEEIRRFNADGHNLARKIRTEAAPEVCVQYAPLGGGPLEEIPA